MGQYYIGVDGDQVRIFQGVRGDVLGLPLHDVVERTDLNTSDLTESDRSAIYNGIVSSHGLEGARNVVHVADRPQARGLPRHLDHGHPDRTDDRREHHPAAAADGHSGRHLQGGLRTSPPSAGTVGGRHYAAPMLIGAHVREDDPIVSAAERGAEIVQMFLADPQGSKKPPVAPAGRGAAQRRPYGRRALPVRP